MNNEIKNLKKWPNQWYDHFVQYCNLYFYDKNIDSSPIASVYVTNNEECEKALFYFFYNNKQYEVSIFYNDNNFICEICRISIMGIIEERNGAYVTLYEEKNTPLAGMGGEKKLNNIINFIESVIKSDNFGDNDRDEDDFPIVPSPIESIDFVGV